MFVLFLLFLFFFFFKQKTAYEMSIGDWSSDVCSSDLNLPRAPFSAGDFLDFQAQNQSFEKLAGIHRVSFTMTGRGAAERLPGMVVTPNFFTALGVQPILGRNFLPSEGVFGAPRVALLTYGFWQAHFGGQRDVTARASCWMDGRCRSWGCCQRISIT